MVFGLFGRKDIEYIVSLYEDHCGSGRSFGQATYSDPRSMLRALRSGESEFRLGSRWTDLSKLLIQYSFLKRNVNVEFDLNPDSSVTSQQIEEALRAGLEFRTKAKEYLVS